MVTKIIGFSTQTFLFERGCSMSTMCNSACKIRRYSSSHNTYSMPLGSPSAEVIKPDHTEYVMFKENLMRRSERLKIFSNSELESLEDGAIQLDSLLKGAINDKELLSLYLEKSAQIFNAMTQEVCKLNKRVRFLEELVQKKDIIE